MVNAVIISIVTFLLLVITPTITSAQKIGLDLLSLNPCLYGDCEARGSYAADPWGWPNPATMTYSLNYVKRGVFFSGGHFFVNAGDMNADISSGTMTVAYDPFVFQVNGVKATGGGYVKGPVPGVRLNVNMPVIRAAAAVDLDRFVPGLSVGLLGALPVVDSKINVTLVPLSRLPVARIKEARSVDITGGAFWHGGHRDWLMLGAYVNGASFDDKGRYFDPSTFTFVNDESTSNAWYARVGASFLPYYGYGQLMGQHYAVPTRNESMKELLSEIRLGIDWEHRNLTVPAEGTRDQDIGYFGADFRALPDYWNVLHPLVRPYGIVGVDTMGGWGAGLGLYGNPDGLLGWLSVNLGYSSRPLTPSFGRTNTFAVSASVSIPLDWILGKESRYPRIEDRG